MYQPPPKPSDSVKSNKSRAFDQTRVLLSQIICPSKCVYPELIVVPGDEVVPPKRLIGIWSILLATSSTKTAQTASSFHDRGASVKDAMVCPSVRGTRGLAE
jgi:hypothetical protein